MFLIIKKNKQIKRPPVPNGGHAPKYKENSGNMIIPRYKRECKPNSLLREYQIPRVAQALEILTKHKIAYYVAETRTGKTLMSLSTAQMYGASDVLFVTKKKAIPEVKNDFDFLKPNFGITITNYEALHRIHKRSDFDLIIADEAHTLGGYTDPLNPSKRVTDIKVFCKNKPVILLSATPSPESFSTLFYEFHISDFSPWAKYETFKEWAKDYVDVKIKRVPHPCNDYSHAKKDMILKDISKMKITLTQKESGFKFEIQEKVIQCPVPTSIKDLFSKLTKDRFLIISNQDITADTPAKKKSKAHQLSSGSLITDTREYLVLSTYKVQHLKKIIDIKEIKKPIVFYKYKSEFGLLQSFFWETITSNPVEFQSSEKSMFSAQYISGREGIRLDSGDAVFFFSPDFAYLSYEQAKNRLQDMTRETAPSLYWLLGLDVDRSIMETVKKKKDYTASHFKKEFLKDGKR